MKFHYLKFLSTLFSGEILTTLREIIDELFEPFFLLLRHRFDFDKYAIKTSNKTFASQPRNSIFSVPISMNNSSDNFSSSSTAHKSCQQFWRAVKVKALKLCVAAIQCRSARYRMVWLVVGISFWMGKIIDLEIWVNNAAWEKIWSVWNCPKILKMARIGSVCVVKTKRY